MLCWGPLLVQFFGFDIPITGNFIFIKFETSKLTQIPLISRLEGDSYSHYKAMLISLSLHLIILMFELLACDRLSSGRHLWTLVFIPLIFGSVASVGAAVWAVKHDRSFEVGFEFNLTYSNTIIHFFFPAGIIFKCKCITICFFAT